MDAKQQRRRVWWAVLASVFVHLLVAFSVAAFNRGAAPLPLIEDKPVELTMVDLSATPPPSKPVNPPYIETDPAKESAEEPTEKTFESNANSKAASQLPATGDAPVPTQEGKERPFLQMQTQESSIAMQPERAQPPPQPTPPPPSKATPAPVQTPQPTASAKPTATATATPLPEPVATPEPDKFAMLTSTPPPALRDLEPEPPSPDNPPTAPPLDMRPRPERPPTAYRPEKTETKITGRISDRGPASVNAVGTPLGRYQKAVSDAIGSRWYYYMKSKMDVVNVGTAVISAEIDREGRVANLRVISNSANEAFANVCLQSFQEAKIAPIPDDLVAALPDGKMPLEFSFTTYANR